MEPYYKKLLDDSSNIMMEFKSNLPELMTSFNGVAKSISKDGALSRKTKELIALALAVGGHCQSCIAFHVDKLIKLDVTREELLEMISVAVYMGGGPSMMYATQVMMAFNELKQ